MHLSNGINTELLQIKLHGDTYRDVGTSDHVHFNQSLILLLTQLENFDLDCRGAVSHKVT